MKTFYKILDTTNVIALATAIDNVPNVRIVNFCYDINRPGVLYFSSDRKNPKVEEFNTNNKIAFTTVPNAGCVKHIRSCHATVQKSNKSLTELQDLFTSKIKGYDEAIAAIGEDLEIFEIHIQEATIIIGFDGNKTVKF